MKQILFAVLLCVSSICSAQNLTSQGSDRSYAEPLDGDTFHLKIKNKYNYAVDSDNPLCNIVKFKRISENEMLLVGSKQDYRLTADLPFKLEWGKVNNEFFHGFELRGLYVCAPNYSAGMTIRVKVEDASQTPIFDKVYSLLTPIDLYVEYVGTDQKKYTANLSNGWFEHDIDYKKDIRLFLKTGRLDATVCLSYDVRSDGLPHQWVAEDVAIGHRAVGLGEGVGWVLDAEHS